MTDDPYRNLFEVFNTPKGKKALAFIMESEPAPVFLDPEKGEGAAMVYKACHLDGQRYVYEGLKQSISIGEQRVKKARGTKKKKARTYREKENIPTDKEGDIFI